MSAATTDPANPNNPYTNFQAGVTAALRSWSALRTAVEQSWGGTTSSQKAEDLRSNIFTYFDGTTPNPKMKLEELEDNLLGYMEEEFGVVLEDGSEIELANLIWNMYECCARGDVTLANSVVANAIKAEEVLKQSNVKSVIQSGQDGDDDMDDDSDAEGDDNVEMENDNNATARGGESTGQQQSMMHMQQQQQQQMGNTNVVEAYASGYLFGGPPKPKKELPPPRQLGEAEPEKPQPVVDDDGFAMVTTKKKGKKR